jgi:uncharacterized protein YbjQ (UPF0145 family)
MASDVQLQERIDRINPEISLASVPNPTIDEMLDAVQTEILCVTTQEIAGKTTKEILGIVRGMSQGAYKDKDFSIAEKEALINMLEAARKTGANAVVATNIASISHEENGSKWHKSRIVYVGTAVKI